MYSEENIFSTCFFPFKLLNVKPSKKSAYERTRVCKRIESALLENLPMCSSDLKTTFATNSCQTRTTSRN